MARNMLPTRTNNPTEKNWGVYFSQQQIFTVQEKGLLESLGRLQMPLIMCTFSHFNTV